MDVLSEALNSVRMTGAIFYTQSARHRGGSPSRLCIGLPMCLRPERSASCPTTLSPRAGPWFVRGSHRGHHTAGR